MHHAGFIDPLGRHAVGPQFFDIQPGVVAQRIDIGGDRDGRRGIAEIVGQEWIKLGIVQRQLVARATRAAVKADIIAGQ